MIVEVFVTHHQAVDSLGEKLRHTMLDALGVAVIIETTREPRDQSRALLDFA